MFLILSFLTAFIALYCLADAASYHPYGYNYDYTLPVVTLLIYSIVCIIREIKKITEDSYGDNWYVNNNRQYDNYQNNNYSHIKDNHNDWLDKYGTRGNSTTVIETYTPNEKEKKNEKRPMVLHVPSKQEARDTIKELEKSWVWRLKRCIASFFGIDITSKYYEARYVEDKSFAKEDHKRFMPKSNNISRCVYVSEYEKSQYNDVVKHIGRSCDIAIGNEQFIEIEEKNDDKPRTNDGSIIVNNN